MRFSLAAGLCFLFLMGCSTPQKTEQERNPAFSLFKSQPLEGKDILAAASSPFLKTKKARVIIDNDAAFDSKIEAIRSAVKDETIRLFYYVYSDDHSSAVFTEELLKAAERGVHVKLMVDLPTNYGRLDLFNWMQEKSRGQIQVRFYGRPSPLIIRDVMFMTQPCPPLKGKISATTCSDAKWAALEGQAPDELAQLMLSGMYSQNMNALETSILKGQLIDVQAYKKGPSSSADLKQLAGFLKLVYGAKVQGNILDNIKVALAYQLHGAQLNPVMNDIMGKIPLSQKGEKSFQDWEHVTDFIHHKVLIVGQRFMQLGGRNIENSYNMKPNPLTAKYIFMDTDMAVEIDRGGEAVTKSYDELFNFSEMVISLKDLKTLMPNDFVANREAAKATVETCAPQALKTSQQRGAFVQCLRDQLPKHSTYRTAERRLQDLEQDQILKAQKYRDEYAPQKTYTQTWKKNLADGDQLAPEDMSRLQVAYIENLPFDKRQPVEKRERRYGAKSGRELKDGKNIHHLWYKGLENTCATSAKENRPERIILHSAYFLPPAILMKGMAKMMDGSWDCHNVKMTFLTNSFETTDLNWMNVAAKYQMLAFFQIYKNRRATYGDYAAARSAQFEYFEYKKPAQGQQLSLHTKLTILGDDFIIGSANADVRSYYMDTNNGFYVRGATRFVQEYEHWLDGLLGDPARTRNLTQDYESATLTREILFKQDRAMIEALIVKFHLQEKVGGKSKEMILGILDNLSKTITETTQKILSRDFIHEYGPFNEIIESKKTEEQDRLEQKFNRLFQLL